MRKTLLLLLLMIGFLIPGACWADAWEAGLEAGTDSVDGAVHYKRSLDNGYMKTGVSGLYTDDDDKEYKWGVLNFALGSENIKPGLGLEVGLKGIFGDAEDAGFSGDVGALAFSGSIGYTFPERMIPIPFQVFGGLSYAPEILSFRDTDEFLSYHLGVGLRVISNAWIRVSYTAYDVDFDAGPSAWNLDDNAIRIGLSMRF